MYCPYMSCTNCCPFIRNQYSNQPMRVIQQSDPVSVTTKEIKYQKPFIKADLRIPVIHGIPNTNIQNYINNSFESDIMEFSRQMNTAANKYGTKASLKKQKFIPYAISSVYELSYNKSNTLSMLLIYHEFVNGLNSFIKVPYNFNTRTGKSLMLQDIFVPGADYKALINKAIRDELIKNKQKYYPKTLATFKGVAEDQPFYLQNGYLVVFFGFNEIAPTEAQIPVFKIPLSSFGNAVKPAYR